MSNTLFGYLTSDLSFSSFSYLFDGPVGEDGEKLVNSVHVVIATAPDGTRFMRPVGKSEWCYYQDPEDYDVGFFSRNIDPADLDHRAGVLADKLNSIESPKLNEEVWGVAEPEYGSAAYDSEWYHGE